MVPSLTMLAQVLTWVLRSPIETLDQVYGTGRPRRGLSRWSQCGALVFAQLAERHRWRDVACALASQANALALLGLRPPKRSTLAEANARRPVALYQALFETLYARCWAVAPQHRFRFKNPFLSLDSTTISLCLNVFPGLVSAPPKGPSRCIPSLTMLATSPLLWCSQRASAVTSRSPAGSTCPWTAS